MVLTPHVMGLSLRGTAQTFADAAQGVADVLAGRDPAAVADPHWREHRAATRGEAVTDTPGAGVSPRLR